MLYSLLLITLLLLPTPAWSQTVPDLDHPLLKNLKTWWRGVSQLSYGDKWYDLMPGTLNNGTLTNMGFDTTTGASPASHPGGFGTVQINFDGTNDYVETTQNVGFTQTSPFTICLWALSTNATKARQSLIQNCAGSDFNAILTRFGDGDTKPEMSIGPNGSATQEKIKATTNLSINTWYHICFTYDGSLTVAGMLIYGNGQPLAITTVVNTGFGSNFTDNPWRIGAHRSASPVDFFPGSMASILILSRALSAMEIAMLYDQERQGVPNLLLVGQPPNLVSTLMQRAFGSLLPFFR